MYADEVGYDNDDSCTRDNNWKDRKNPEIDLKDLVADVGIDNDEVDVLDNENAFHLNDGFSDIEDTANDRVQH